MTCIICQERKKIEINENNFFLRIDSTNKKLHDYKNYICYNCGTIYHLPKIKLSKLINHYNNDYRNTESFLKYEKNKLIDLPIRFEWTGTSFTRFYAFYKIINSYKKIKFQSTDKILDFGCYQGAFLYACREVFKTKVVGTDYSEEGLKMAEKFFNIKTYKTTKNFFGQKIQAKLITLLHVFEHLDDPVNFLQKIKKNLLKKNGYIYLEIPNPFSNPLNDPTHLNLYSEETIKYILKSTNYQLCHLEKKENYKNTNLLRNNKELNIHVLAKSINSQKFFFEKIAIGPKIKTNLQKKRHKLSIIFVMKKIRFFLLNFVETIYIILIFFLNFFSPKFTISFHELLKKKFK
jgi:2-polyprenyl-3-methyl-5-hydroxy-6-metoxy-1,4-benzoquinol methylase